MNEVPGKVIPRTRAWPRTVALAAWLSVLAGILLLAPACDLLSPEDKRDLLFRRVAVSGTPNSKVPWVAVHESGDLVAAIETSGQITGAVYRSRAGQSFSVDIGSNGLPTKAVVAGYVIVFENWGGGKVDAAVIAPNGTVTLHRGLSSPVSAPTAATTAAMSQVNAVSGLRPAEALRFAAISLSVAGCVTAIIMSAGIAVPCGVAIVEILVALNSSDDRALRMSSGALSVAAGAIGCSRLEPFSCASLVANIASIIAEAHQSAVESQSNKIAGATGALRFGGVWARDDVKDAWFIVETEEARDAFLAGSCYIFYRGRFVKVDGDVFSYSTGSGTVALRYTSLSATRLRITRLADGFTATLTKSARASSSFTPECRTQNLFDRSILLR